MQKSWTALALLMAVGMSGTSPTETRAPLDRFGWIAGCWELRTPTRIIHEQWMAPLGGMMLGMSRTVVRDSVREYEQLRIESRNGVATYIANPSGQKETAFPAISAADSMFVFENPTHDFPQRISYRRVGSDSLVARIEGMQGGQLRGINFPMRRTICGQ